MLGTTTWSALFDMSTEGWFRKKVTFPDTAPGQSSATVPVGLAVKCVKCSTILFNRDFDKNLRVCTKCGHHSRLTVDQRIEFTVDEGTFKEFGEDLRSLDPLQFPDYADKLAKSIQKLGTGESFRIGFATIEGNSCLIGVSEFAFRGGTLGAVAGEKIILAMEAGAKLGLPVVLFTASGGARMEEGLLALMQMAKTSAAAALLSKAKQPLIIVLADPTTGGVLASYASLGDILISEPGAYIAFAGSRVAKQAQTQKLPDDYQTAEYRLAHGQLDMVVHRRELPMVLGRLLSMLSRPTINAGLLSGRNGNGNGNGTNEESVASNSLSKELQHSEPHVEEIL
jgi:acetyl-CoA carboxylase carboxyl transferase subunit beta